MTSRVKQPAWQLPAGTAPVEGLRIYNSLTREKDAFIPQNKDGPIYWYSCGITPYAEAHVGHARNYVSTDTIRRIMTDYFKLPIRFIQNVTDIDDKIIRKARQLYLFEKFRAQHSSLDSLSSHSTSKGLLQAYSNYIEENLQLMPRDSLAHDAFWKSANERYPDAVPLQYSTASKTAAPTEIDAEKLAKTRMRLTAAGNASDALHKLQQRDPSLHLDTFYSLFEDVLSPYLDVHQASSINQSNYGIFTNLTEKYEQMFTEDMRALNVRDPDVKTKVTEYVPQIIAFTEQVVRNGFAYQTADGSVYFDINSFKKAGQPYARLEPWSVNDMERAAESEDNSTKGNTAKRSENDFALWKASKAGEPAWDSPWGKGRPGWHIECSAMAADVTGRKILDIHSGGIDLAFPHHDNELAQSEAYFFDKSDSKASNSDCSHAHDGHWVNYFLHMGHLSIQGAKMSKSLKNFTSIRDALKGEWNARSMRLAFMLGPWERGIELTEGTKREVKGLEDTLSNFFLNARDIAEHPFRPNITTTRDTEVGKLFVETQEEFGSALRDSFNTARALSAISNLIHAYNISDKEQLADKTVLSMARWVTSMVRILGLESDKAPLHATNIGWSGIDIAPEILSSLIPLARLRDTVRNQALNKSLTASEFESLPELAALSLDGKDNDVKALARAFQSNLSALTSKEPTDYKAILALCDRLRDTDLWNLGIYLEDRGGRHALVRPLDDGLRTQRDEAEAKKIAKEAAKAKREEEERKKEAEKAKQAAINPREMYKDPQGLKEYSAWDDDGVPTKDAAGADLPKSRIKKLRKDWERQKKAFDKSTGST